MYQIGEKVVYGMHGVCLVTELEKRIIDRKEITYLVLEPTSQGGSRFLIPTHNAAAMSKVHPLMTPDALRELLAQPVEESVWIPDESRRKQSYRELISSGDRVSLSRMVRYLYRFRSRQTAAGKKLHMCDDNFLRDAEKVLAGEVSAVLEIPQDAALQYIRNKLKEDA